MPRPDRTRRLVRLVLAAFLLGAVASPGVGAQTDGEPDVTQFGGYIASARGNGLQITYDSPNLLPTGSPVIQFSVPEALANLNTGPVGFSRASFLFPGPLIADLGSALAAGGTDAGIPPYPIRSEAFFPSGPTEASGGEAGTEMVATTDFGDSRARSSYAGLTLDPVAFLGGFASSSQAVIEGDQVVSRARSELSDLSIAGGLVHIESVVTDVVATSNGAEAATSGGTEVSGVTVLGLPATVDADGISFDERPSDGGENPIGDAVGGLLGDAGRQLGDALGGVVGPLNDLFDQLQAAGDDALQQLFEASGIDIRVLEPDVSIDGSTAVMRSGGLSITLNYDGQDTPLLSDLVALVPSSDLPSENLGPIPFSPQALVKLLERIHSIGFVVAPADVSAKATPAFEAGGPSPAPPPATGSAPSTPPSGGTTGGNGFTTATPDLPSPSDSGGVGSVPVSTDRSFPFGNAIPAIAVLALVVGAPAFAAGSSRLADNTLAPVVASCPEGLDQPPTQETGR